MTLLNPALALGALAFMIPLIIHILNRSRFRTVDWGAMHLLESVIQVNYRRFRIDQLILLLVRCLIPALLAFCIARPLLTGSKTMDSNAPVSLMILLDTSYSMATEGPGGQRFQQAMDAAKSLVMSTSKGSDIGIVLMSDQPISLFDQPIFDKQAVVRQLDNITSQFGPCDIRSSLQVGLEQLEQMSNPYRELIVLSDFHAQDWRSILQEDSQKILQQLESMKLKPALSLIPIGSLSQENVSVNAIDHPQQAIGAGEPHTYRVTLQNHGPKRIDNARVTFEVNGNEEMVSQVSLVPGGSTQVLFEHTFQNPGSHWIKAEVANDDALQIDNRLSISMTAWDRIKVLLIDGAPDPKPLKSETDFLQIALTPFTLGRFQLADLLDCETLSVNQLAVSDIEATKVVVLANVPRLTTEQTEALKAHVNGGGLLLVFPGDRIDLKWYREQLYDSGNGLLPAPFGPLKNSETRPLKIVTQRFDHPALQSFNDPENGDLTQPSIFSWYQINQDSSELNSNKDLAVNVMARLENSDPLLLERMVGEGLVIQMTTSCDVDWNDLPRYPVYLPLMQQLVTSNAARLVPNRNLIAGEPAVMQLDSESAPQTIVVQSPDQAETVIQSQVIADRQTATFPYTSRPGIYTFVMPQQTIRYAVQPDREESVPGLLDRDGIDQVAKGITARVYATAADYLSEDNLRRNGSEIWKYLLAAFLAFLFLEVVLQQKFSRVKT